MLKYEKLILNNYFGLDYRNQEIIFNLMINSLDEEEDRNLISSLKNIFEYYLNDLKELYDINEKGLKLKTFYVERLLDKTSISVENFMNNKKVFTEEDYKGAYLFNINDYNMDVIKSMDKFFDVNYIDEDHAMEFINSYKSSNKYEQKRFILQLIKNYFIVTYLPKDYIPGVNNINNDFDDLVINLFGEEAFKKYNRLKPIQKVKFIRKYKIYIDEFYQSQINNSKKDIKSRRLTKRKHSPSYIHR